MELKSENLPNLFLADTSNEIDSFEQWLNQRNGRFTASEIYRILTYQEKPDYISAGALSYIEEKALEVLTNGKSRKTFFNLSMKHGKTFELEAIAKAEEKLIIKFEKTGKDQEFIEYGSHAGCTPDGLSEKLGIEVKCPDCKTHFKYLKIKNQEDLKRTEPKYYWQIQKGMLCTGLKQWYFVSYDPRFTNEKNQLLTLLIHENDKDIEFLKQRLKLAISKKIELINQ
ncbi:hypothetical protein ETU08_00210 [Apibacter muscae]|uniref:YqaJ viral recombinase family protein n=1 Tax=Apibacter muscae TaxID=2509004 RepID=UPI0011ABE0F6|nr:YqaJ viral recombinase family protein [Apibacter muscae]TWP31916.1 hypothetical protein ETU08_00210 [Apibacter muscae]